jgi:hypothetical protein
MPESLDGPPSVRPPSPDPPVPDEPALPPVPAPPPLPIAPPALAVLVDPLPPPAPALPPAPVLVAGPAPVLVVLVVADGPLDTVVGAVSPTSLEQALAMQVDSTAASAAAVDRFIVMIKMRNAVVIAREVELGRALPRQFVKRLALAIENRRATYFLDTE